MGHTVLIGAVVVLTLAVLAMILVTALIANERNGLAKALSSCDETPTGLGFDPAPMYPNKSEMTLAEWRALIPEPHDKINGEVPPGIPVATNSTLLDLHKVEKGTCFVSWWIPGRLVGYRTPIHFHPRPQEVCVVSGALLTMIEGREPQEHRAGECFMMPQMTKMLNLAIGTNVTQKEEVGYTDFDIFRVPDGEPEWVVIEPNHLDIQGEQFVRGDGCESRYHTGT